MSNDSGPPSGDPSDHEHRPNWGSAYPPPQGGAPPPPGYGYGYQPYSVPPKHPGATTSMVLGIVGVAAGVLCWLPFFLSPFAWITGSKAIREIDASRGAQGGRGEAMAGKVLGIIGTVLLVLGIAGIVLFIVLALTIDNFWDAFWDDEYDEYDSYDSYDSAAQAALAHLPVRS